MTITLEYSRMCAPEISGGVTESEWAGLQAAFVVARGRVRDAAGTGAYGFADLTAQDAEHARVRAFADTHRAHYDDIVVLGIGGSSLGLSMLQAALLPPWWNERDAVARSGRPRLHVLDNVDPRSLQARLALLALPRTLFVVVSKSGGTAETLAQYLVVRARVQAAGLDPVHHFVVVTDPEQGALRDHVRTTGYAAFEVPRSVGGRYSLFTPVVTLAAALAGIDTAALRSGAADMHGRCTGEELARDPSGLFALLQWRAHRVRALGIHVMMPYGDALRGLAPWFVQLWAESLGKHDTAGVSVGPTPLSALGASDQHSQLQLFMEGPADKTLTFIAEGARESDLRIPVASDGPVGSEYLQGASLGALLDAERRATAAALAAVGRPSMTFSIDRCDAWHIGGLTMLLMHATVLAGALYGVDPLNQPGVELGKRLARESLAAKEPPEASSRRV